MKNNPKHLQVETLPLAHLYRRSPEVSAIMPSMMAQTSEQRRQRRAEGSHLTFKYSSYFSPVFTNCS